MPLENQKGLRFGVGTGLISGITWFLLQYIMPLLQTITAKTSAAMLSLFGNAYSQGALVFFNTLSVQVIPLCVGDIEIAVLTGAIIATEDRELKDRVLGVATAFVFVMMINAVRITLTMIAWQSIGTAAIELVHSMLFRATLVIAIVGFYATWYLRDLLKEKLKLNQLLREK